MVSGSVDAFSDSDKASLQAKVATTAGVDKSLVVISVAAASVRVTAMITVPASTTPFAVNITLTSRLGTVAAASTALAVALEEVPIITIMYDGIPDPPVNRSWDPPPDLEDDTAPKDDQPEGMSTILVGTVAGAVAVAVFLALYFLGRWRLRVVRRGQKQRGQKQRAAPGPGNNIGSNVAVFPGQQAGVEIGDQLDQGTPLDQQIEIKIDDILTV